MARDPAEIIDRRRLKRRLNFWRTAAVVAVIAAALTVASNFEDTGFSDHVARLEISGIIFNDPVRDKALRRAARRGAVKALIVEIDSPGGTFVGGEALYNHLRSVAEEKPVVAVMGGTATSAAYMAAIGTSRVFARNGTVTGSIGVIMQTADITGMLEKLGIKPETVKSGPLKAQPNPIEPFLPAAREATEVVVGDLFAMFVDMVATRRKMDRDKVLALSDGRVYSGRQAREAGLVDAIGGVAEARRWLAENHQVDAGLPLEDLDVQDDDEPWRYFIDSVVGKTLFSERLRLDGVLSVWQPKLK
jgi:protease-4